MRIELKTLINFKAWLGNLLLIAICALPCVAETLVVKGQYLIRSQETPSSRNPLAATSNTAAISQDTYLLSKKSLFSADLQGSKMIERYDSVVEKQDCEQIASEYSLKNYTCEANFLYSSTYAMNDTHSSLQYSKEVMHLPAAWEISQEGEKVVVAIIDSGIDIGHEDLSSNIWVNSSEVAGNFIDDDNNGYVDDSFGVDVTKLSGSGFDKNGHGTHVAGIIGAVASNNKGITGVALNVKLMPIKFIDESGFGTTSNAVKAIDYAIANGARIINASWGAEGASSLALKEAIERARDAGIIFIAAAGNNGKNTDQAKFYPAGYSVSNIISVGATDSNDNLADFSNFGVQSVDILAPGVDIISTYPRLGYAYLSGTSMAAPHVTGLAAMLASLHPDFSVYKIKRSIVEGADILASAKKNTKFSARINAESSLLVADSIAADPEEMNISLKVHGRPPVKTDKASTNINLKLSSSGSIIGDEYKIIFTIADQQCIVGSYEFESEESILKAKLSKDFVGFGEFAVFYAGAKQAIAEIKVKTTKRASKRGLKSFSKICSELKIR